MAHNTSKKPETNQPDSHNSSAGNFTRPATAHTLTPRQQEVFDLLVFFIQKNGYPPSTTELADLLGFSSPNAAAEHLKALERKGIITITRGVSRGIAIAGDKEPLLAMQLLQEMIDDQPGARERAAALLKLHGAQL
ncbi:DNA-binding protein [Enterobacter sp. Ap-916]|uniref:LexA family protein n=1 Tax=unclassified Enterobacter TaxID=2608935 RepID=UPI00142321DE|nr:MULTISPECIES: DNA-binding protein [unclassified Enterobacter]NIF58945.1 DNA-binding protein [Enterobacter sp. Ap-867]NIG29639.1 DNA-binding protein [Enterobacter sp. Ap-916]